MDQSNLYQQAMYLDPETGRPMSMVYMVGGSGGGGGDAVGYKTNILKTEVISKTTPMTIRKSETKYISKLLVTSDDSNSGSVVPPVNIHIGGVLFMALVPIVGEHTLTIDFPNLVPSGDMVITTTLDMITITVIGEGV